MTLSQLAIVCLLASGIYLAWSDIRHRRLPNVVTGVLAVAGLLASLATGSWAQAGNALLHCLIALGIGFGLFAARLIGSGDAKYYAATATWFPLGKGMLLLGWVSIAGFVLALSWLVWKRLANTAERGEGAFAKLPFGVAIAAGALGAAVSVSG